MSYAEMSRRASMLSSTQAVKALSKDDHAQFLQSISHAQSVADLPNEFQTVFIAAEKELEDAGWARDDKHVLRSPEWFAATGSSKEVKPKVKLVRKL